MCRRPSVLVSALGLGLVIGLTAACEEPQAQFPIARPAAPGTCLDWVGQPVDRRCIPRVARADAPLVLEVEERCGACGSIAERCTVTVDEKEIKLSLDGRACEPEVGAQCTESCSKRRIRCEVPPLSEGRYRVHYGDASGAVDTLTLVQQPDATTSCILDDAPKG